MSVDSPKLGGLDVNGYAKKVESYEKSKWPVSTQFLVGRWPQSKAIFKGSQN